MRLITNEFYLPTWLLPEIEKRITVKVANMRKAENLPHLNEKLHLWAQMKGSNLGKNLFQQRPSTDRPPKGIHSTGTWGLARKEKCQNMFDVKSIKTCLMCGTAPMSEASKMDAKLLKVAQDQQPNRQTNKQTDYLFSPTPALIGGRAGPPQAAPTQENTSFSAADLSTFKASKQRKMALAARSGIKDKRPLPEDNNRFKDLLARRRGLSPAVRVITRILKMFRAAGSKSTEGPAGAGLYQKALWLLFSAERTNSFITVGNRRGNPAFPLVEQEKILLTDPV